MRCSYFDYPRFAFRPPRFGGVPVAVVGGGPVGLVAAIELGRRGINTVLLHAGDTVSEGSRATCISRRSMEILQQNGAIDRFLAEALPWTHGRTFYRRHLIYRLAMPHSDDERYYPIANLQQNLFEFGLLQRALELPAIDVRWLSRVVDVRQDTDGVMLTVQTPEGDYTQRARYVIAADGARSCVRDLCKLRLAGESHSGRYLIADIVMPSTYPTERRAWFDPPSNRHNTVLMHKQARDVWRVDYQLEDGADEAYEVQPARVQARVQAHLDYIGEKTPWRLEWVSLYKAHCLCLDDYRHGRILFAGDAAHLVPIFGVRGMNSGIADANNLGWKLAYVLRGVATDALLDSYSAERRAATLDIFTNARKSTQFMTPPNGGYRLVRDAVLQLAVSETFAQPLANPRQSTAYDYLDSPLNSASDSVDGPQPGAAVANLALGADRFLLDAVGQDFVAFAPTAAVAALESEVSALPDPLTDRIAVRVTERPIGARGDEVFLLRPDGHLCARWRTDRPIALASALRRALARH